MTDDERKVLNETVGVVALMLDRLQWNDLAMPWFEKIAEPLKRLQSQDNGSTEGR